jgi:hypothetical protein
MRLSIIILISIIIFTSNIYAQLFVQRSNDGPEESLNRIQREHENRTTLDDIVRDIPEISDICNNDIKHDKRVFKDIGTCTKDKIALVTYDPYVAPDPSKLVRIATRPPDSDCYILAYYLWSKGYCIESIKLKHSHVIKDILYSAEKNKILDRYSYIAYIGHGLIGGWSTTFSACEHKVWDICWQRFLKDKRDMDGEAFLQCENEEASSEKNQRECPCYKDSAKVEEARKLRDSAIKSNSNEIVKMQQAFNTANSLYGSCTSDGKKKKYYSKNIDAEDYAKLLKQNDTKKPGTLPTIYSISCDTANTQGSYPNQKQVIDLFKGNLCKSAPEYTIFNLSGSRVSASKVYSFDDYQQGVVSAFLGYMDGDSSTNIVDEEALEKLKRRMRDKEARQLLNEYHELRNPDNPKNPKVYKIASGDFSCWQCRTIGGTKIAVSDPNCDKFENSIFPPGVENTSVHTTDKYTE